MHVRFLSGFAWTRIDRSTALPFRALTVAETNRTGASLELAIADYRWPVLGAGRHQMPFATEAAMIGGNVRVGLEDSLYIGRSRFAKGNAEQVAKIRRIVEELGYAIATPAETREMLALKSGDKVAF